MSFVPSRWQPPASLRAYARPKSSRALLEAYREAVDAWQRARDECEHASTNQEIICLRTVCTELLRAANQELVDRFRRWRGRQQTGLSKRIAFSAWTAVDAMFLMARSSRAQRVMIEPWINWNEDRHRGLERWLHRMRIPLEWFRASPLGAFSAQHLRFANWYLLDQVTIAVAYHGGSLALRDAVARHILTLPGASDRSSLIWKWFGGHNTSKAACIAAFTAKYGLCEAEAHKKRTLEAIERLPTSSIAARVVRRRKAQQAKAM